MRIYYLDAPLEGKELEQLRMAVGEPGELHQMRVPCVLPVAENPAARDAAPSERLIQLALRHLHQAGIGKDTGRQVGWVLPCNPQWSELIQAAIRRLTGFYPIAIQRWSVQSDGTLARTPLCVTDLHGMREAGLSAERAR